MRGEWRRKTNKTFNKQKKGNQASKIFRVLIDSVFNTLDFVVFIYSENSTGKHFHIFFLFVFTVYFVTILRNSFCQYIDILLAVGVLRICTTVIYYLVHSFPCRLTHDNEDFLIAANCKNYIYCCFKKYKLFCYSGLCYA